MRFSPHFQLFYFNDRLEFCEFFEWKIKRINNADFFSQLPLVIFTKGANISGGHCIYIFFFLEVVSYGHQGCIYYIIKTPIMWNTVKTPITFNVITNKIPVMATLYFQHHYSSLQCHMIHQKSFYYAEFVLKKQFLKTVVLLNICVETWYIFYFFLEFFDLK